MAEIKGNLLKGIFITLLFLGCKNRPHKSAITTPKDNPASPALMTDEKPKPITPPPVSNSINYPDQVAPGSCRVIGQIIIVKPELEPDKNTPCGKAPCKALIKVLKVVAYGGAFKPLLAEGREIPVYFAFTLSPSATYFPDLTTALPGLKAGSIFQADLQNPAEGNGGTDATYLIYTYIVK